MNKEEPAKRMASRLCLNDVLGESPSINLPAVAEDVDDGVFEKLFESRLFFVDKLIGMGARIVLCDPHRAVIAGPSALRGQVVESPDIRAGMAMLLAALAAQGDSVIQNIGQIERGYEHIDDRLKALGAQIERRS